MCIRDSLTIIIEAFEKAKAKLNTNEYEIMEFIMTQGKYVLGTKELPPKDSALADDQTPSRKELNQSDSEDEDEDINENVEKLPEKMNLFLTYVNNMYFDGQLDISDGRNIVIDSSQGNETSIAQRIIYSSSDDVTTRSPRRNTFH